MNDGAEVYAILMGFHELCKLGGHNPISKVTLSRL